MRYYLDTEFIEGTQEKTIFGIKYGQTKPTIDLISIALVAEDGREYYAISKDFNLKEAWNRYDLITNEYTKGFGYEKEYEIEKEYWIRENVLFPIFVELQAKESKVPAETIKKYMTGSVIDYPLFNYKYFRKLINKYGKTNKQIAEEIKDFCTPTLTGHNLRDNDVEYNKNYSIPEFYAYYADYDWVVFCWLFGKMIALPKGFPKYCNDLKQELDNRLEIAHVTVRSKTDGFSEREYFIGDHYKTTLKDMLMHVKEHTLYPKQTNEHNALADARWNRQLHEFLNSL